MIPWGCYLFANNLQMSGILSIIFCGISMGKYCYPNLTERGRKVNIN